jgi:hypothetical protein
VSALAYYGGVNSFSFGQDVMLYTCTHLRNPLAGKKSEIRK